jgi:hypothetical protein
MCGEFTMIRVPGRVLDVCTVVNKADVAFILIEVRG